MRDFRRFQRCLRLGSDFKCVASIRNKNFPPIQSLPFRERDFFQTFPFRISSIDVKIKDNSIFPHFLFPLFWFSLPALSCVLYPSSYHKKAHFPSQLFFRHRRRNWRNIISKRNLLCRGYWTVSKFPRNSSSLDCIPELIPECQACSVFLFWTYGQFQQRRSNKHLWQPGLRVGILSLCISDSLDPVFSMWISPHIIYTYPWLYYSAYS